MRLEDDRVVFDLPNFFFFSLLVGAAGRNLSHFRASKHIAPSLFAVTLAATKKIETNKLLELSYSKELIASWGLFLVTEWNTQVFLDGSPDGQMFYTCVPPAFIFPFLRIAYAIEMQSLDTQGNDNPKGLSMN